MEEDTKDVDIEMLKNSEGVFEMVGLSDTLTMASLQRMYDKIERLAGQNTYDRVMRGINEEDLRGGFVSRFTYACQMNPIRKGIIRGIDTEENIS